MSVTLERPQTIPLTALTIEDDLQSRCEIDLGLIEHYAALLMEGVILPAVVVFQQGEQRLLADGFHRLRAHQVLERATIACLVHPGTRLDAVRYSLAANATHGKPRSRGDMVRAYETAKRLGLIAPGDATRLRALLQCSSAWAFKLTEVDREIGRRERHRAILQKRAEGKGQRQIARETGIAVQTVNAVIHRLSENSTVEFSDTPVNEALLAGQSDPQLGRGLPQGICSASRGARGPTHLPLAQEADPCS